MATIFLNPANQFPSELQATQQTQTLLSRCSSMEEVKQIHAQMFKQGIAKDTIPVSRLLTFCTSPDFGELAYAQKVFNSVRRANTFMWNTIIRGFAEGGYPEQALVLYGQMLGNSVQHNGYTFPFLLKACCNTLAFEETRQIHACIIKMGFSSEIFTVNSLLHIYAVLGSIDSARLLFDRLLQRDTVSWNSMIDGYVKCRDMEKAYEIFNSMESKNAISWTTLISGYVTAGLYKEALKLFHRMQIAGVKPDNVTLSSAISACSHLGSLDQGRWVHTYVKRTGIQIDPVLGCALIDMYAKCGELKEALKLFSKMEKKNVSTWTAMIFGFAIHGDGREALNIFSEMEKAGIKPNLVTFTAILTACTHAGLVNEGKSLFQNMEKKYSLKPTIEHYGCMVDLLGRAGMLEEAKQLITTMPIRPNSVILGALVKACRIHRNLDLGKQIGRILIESEPDHGGRYIHLASIYAMARKWDRAVEVRREMVKMGVSKFPGCSSISLNGISHEFLAGDSSHPQMDEIKHNWDRIRERLKQEGYKPAIGDLLLDLEDEEKETAVHQHSEKLAVTFGLIKSQAGVTIRIIKNLRVCEDCHTVMKFISRIYDREIIMRDRTRFHHFHDGKCTCGDYW